VHSLSALSEVTLSPRISMATDSTISVTPYGWGYLRRALEGRRVRGCREMELTLPCIRNAARRCTVFQSLAVIFSISADAMATTFSIKHWAGNSGVVRQLSC
jgi:hypothetical protein